MELWEPRLALRAALTADGAGQVYGSQYGQMVESDSSDT